MDMGMPANERTAISGYRKSKYRRFVGSISHFIKSIGFTPPIWPMVVVFLLVLDVSLQQPALLVMGVLIGLVVVMAEQLTRLVPQIRLSNKIPFSWLSWRVMAGATIGAFFLINELSIPANAQFMINAQNFFEQSFPEAADVAPLVFNVVRAVYVIYIVIALVGVVNTARQDDDWKTAARTPALVVLVVTIGDVLSTLITG